MTLLHSLRMQARKVGLEITRADYNAIEALRLAKQLETNSCDVVLDVGANTGQFASELFDVGGYCGEIISVDPLPEAHRKLTENAKESRRHRWRVAPRMALGSRQMATTIYVSENSVSSSLAPMANAHLEAAPDSRVTGQIPVDVYPLSALLDQMDIRSNRIFLKIDTQGTERDVLEGALPVLDRIAGIKLELSATELYQGQQLYFELDAFIRGCGYELWDIVCGFRHPTTTRMLQFDGIYFRQH